MIVVSDTSPIRYLVLIRAIDVLQSLFGELLIPPTVAAELSHPKAPVPVRDWFQSAPTWVKVRAPLKVDPIDRLDPGELEAISLALELDADRLLVDDNAGRRAAKRLGISAVGTLAILDLAGKQGLLDFPKSLRELESNTNFRISRSLRDRLLDEHLKTSREDPTDTST